MKKLMIITLLIGIQAENVLAKSCLNLFKAGVRYIETENKKRFEKNDNRLLKESIVTNQSFQTIFNEKPKEQDWQLSLQEKSSNAYNQVALYASDAKQQWVDKPLEDRRIKQNNDWAESDSQNMLAKRSQGQGWQSWAVKKGNSLKERIPAMPNTSDIKAYIPNMPNIDPAKQYIAANYKALTNQKPATSLVRIEEDPYLQWIENRKKMA